MRNIKSIVMAVIAGLILVGCSNTKEPAVEQGSATDLYDKADLFFKDSNYKEALKYFQAVSDRFPYGVYGKQSGLNAIYAAYQMQDYTKTLGLAETYLRSYPQSPHLDYVLYVAGLANSAIADNYVQDLFKVDQATRDVSSLKGAYQSFSLLEKNFPNSPYAADAKVRMEYIVGTLARHQLDIVKFYQKRKAYVAVINRALELLRDYPESEAAYQVLPILINAYKAVKLPDLAERFENILKASGDPKFKQIAKPKSDPKLEVPNLL